MIFMLGGLRAALFINLDLSSCYFDTKGFPEEPLQQILQA